MTAMLQEHRWMQPKGTEVTEQLLARSGKSTKIRPVPKFSLQVFLRLLLQTFSIRLKFAPRSPRGDSW